MPFTVNTVLKGRPATIEVSKAGITSCKSDGRKWEFNQDMHPARYTREDGDTITFSQMKDGIGYASVSYNGTPMPAIPTDISNTPTLQSFVPVMQAISAAADTPGFPQEVKAKLEEGFKSLGQAGKGI